MTNRQIEAKLPKLFIIIEICSFGFQLEAEENFIKKRNRVDFHRKKQNLHWWNVLLVSRNDVVVSWDERSFFVERPLLQKSFCQLWMSEQIDLISVVNDASNWKVNEEMVVSFCWMCLCLSLVIDRFTGQCKSLHWSNLQFGNLDKWTFPRKNIEEFSWE